MNATLALRPVPVHVLTGFLGSGKTTLLNRMLRDPALANSAVVVNEFGDIGIDHLLVRQGEDATLALVGGCLCCELRDGLALTLVDLLARRRRGECLAFERIIIETTGLADPLPIVNLLATEPLLAEGTVAGHVVTVVDALNAPRTLREFSEAVAQVVLADHVVISKTDRIRRDGAAVGLIADRVADPALGGDSDRVCDLAATLRALAPEACVHAAGVDHLPSLRALFAGPHRVRGVPAVHDEHAHHAAHNEGAVPAHAHLHRAKIHSFFIEREHIVPGAAVTLFAQALAAQFGDDLLRVKGLVRVAEWADRPLLVQGAQRVFHPLEPLEAWPVGYPPCTRLVFIVRGSRAAAAAAFVERLFDALIWEAGDIGQRLRAAAAAKTSVATTQERVSCSI